MACRKKLEFQERERGFYTRQLYSLPVHVANWYEDNALKEEKTNNAAYKADHCELLVQKTKKMFRNLLRPTILSQDSEHLRYGDCYMITACDAPNYLSLENRIRGNVFGGLSLSGLISELEIESVQHFVHGCRLTVANTREHTTRNTFRFISADDIDKCGNPVNYCEDLYIQIVDEGETPLYIQSLSTTVTSLGSAPTARLSKYTDIFCRFKIVHWDPDLRMETANGLIQPGARVLIVHCASGKNLTVESTNMVQTFFGIECEVSCKFMRDTHKMEAPESFWNILGFVPINKNYFARAAKGEDVPEYLME